MHLTPPACLWNRRPHLGTEQFRPRVLRARPSLFLQGQPLACLSTIVCSGCCLQPHRHPHCAPQGHHPEPTDLSHPPERSKCVPLSLAGLAYAVPGLGTLFPAFRYRPPLLCFFGDAFPSHGPLSPSRGARPPLCRHGLAGAWCLLPASVRVQSGDRDHTRCSNRKNFMLTPADQAPGAGVRVLKGSH